MNTDVDPEVSRSTLSRLLYEVPLARWDSMMLSKCRLKESRLLSEGRRGLPRETGDLRPLWTSGDASKVLLEKRTNRDRQSVGNRRPKTTTDLVPREDELAQRRSSGQSGVSDGSLRERLNLSFRNT